MMRQTFVKPYASVAARVRAQRNHLWLTSHAQPFALPRILSSRSTELEFEWINGRHAKPRDLVMLAAHLGDAHGSAWCAGLHGARLTAVYVCDGHVIPDFVGLRVTALRQRFRDGHIAMAQDLDEALGLLHHGTTGPAAFYKDTNPRNILITPDRRPVTLDTDDLSLAPFGYDLAKLVVTLAMTHGAPPADHIAQALAAYNAAAASHDRELDGTTLPRLLRYADLHGVLTAPYVGRGGYRWPWTCLRPTASSHTSPNRSRLWRQPCR
ncbi:phosphotransferase [Streptomyces sp. 7N604]|uniref:phosphotransferase n=1 Tax=Streptomyces sp. 7N604 TaxID=3457415 RepID=UPI003FD617FE